MSQYPAEPEGPEEIDPAILAEGKRAELLLRNPESWTDNPDGTKTVHAPDPRWMEWSSVPLVADPSDCKHSFSVCAECADSWGTDYYIRFFDGDVCVWLSPDHPDHP